MRITTAGESHGKGLYCIIEGLPSGLKLDFSAVSRALALRQSGYGRGARQKIEHDRAEFLSGVRNGVTLGSPVTIEIKNLDYENWAPFMDAESCDVAARALTKVRPGHADLAGLLKFGGADARNVLERASARETAVRVAAGEVCRTLLLALGVRVAGYVRAVGKLKDGREYAFDEIEKGRGERLGMLDRALEDGAVNFVDECREKGDTAGGVVELHVKGLKSGFGSPMTYREKLDARLCAALMSVQSVKGVEVGLGFAAAALKGSEVHDEIEYDGRFKRRSNRAGGIEGGMSNGEELVLRAAVKPIPTLMRGLATVDYVTKEPARAAAERSDVCALSAAETVLESALLSELCAVVLERLGGDRLDEVVERYRRLP